jgi:very-short-patch-repair endonuclease
VDEASDIPPRERRELLRSKDATRERARELRKNMSKPEVFLWTRLARKRTGFVFHRQKPMGPYIADFYCHEALLVVDGESHRERGDHDRARDGWMSERGVEVMRIAAGDVLADLVGTASRVASVCGRRVELIAQRKQQSALGLHIEPSRPASPGLEDSATPSGSPEGDRRSGCAMGARQS